MVQIVVDCDFLDNEHDKDQGRPASGGDRGHGPEPGSPLPTYCTIEHTIQRTLSIHHQERDRRG